MAVPRRLVIIVDFTYPRLAKGDEAKLQAAGDQMKAVLRCFLKKLPTRVESIEIERRDKERVA